MPRFYSELIWSVVHRWFYFFLTFVQESLIPTLIPGDVVVMDNLLAHKVMGIKESIEKAGARLLYLPPYSPDLSPIELAWSKIKNTLRTIGALTPRKLHQAICQAFHSVSQKILSPGLNIAVTVSDNLVKCNKGKPVKQCSTAAWRKALKRAEIDNFHWHDLRHTWVSWHVQNGTSLQELGLLLKWFCAMHI